MQIDPRQNFNVLKIINSNDLAHVQDTIQNICFDRMLTEMND